MSEDIPSILKRIQSLEARVVELEKLNSTNSQQAFAKTEEPTNTGKVKTSSTTISSTVSTDSSVPTTSEPKRSNALETPNAFAKYFGTNLLGKAGMFAIVIAFLWFIDYSFQNYLVNTSARLYFGIIFGLGVFYFGVRLKDRFPKLYTTILGGGISILFGTYFASYFLFGYMEIQTAFAGLFLLSLVVVGISKFLKSEVLFSFGMLSAYLTPIVLSQGENSYRFLFVYLSILSLLFLYASFNLEWKVFPTIQILICFLFLNTWAYESAAKSSSWAYPYIYLMIVFLVTQFRILFDPSIYSSEKKWIPILETTLVHFFTLGSLIHLGQFYPENLLPFFLTLVPLLSLSLVYFKESKANTKLHFISQFALMGTVLFVLISFYEQFSSLVLCYSLLFLVSSITYYATSLQNRNLTIVSFLFWFYLFIQYFTVASDRLVKGYIFLNGRFFLYLLTSAFILYIAKLWLNKDKIAKFISIIGLVFFLTGHFVEIYCYSSQTYTAFGYSSVFMVYGILFSIIGFQKKWDSFKQIGLVLLAILVAKFYLFDIWSMETIIKIIAGFAFGAGLIGAGMLYNKSKETQT